MNDTTAKPTFGKPVFLTLLGLTVCGGMIAMPFLAGPPNGEQLSDIVRFLGRFHPVILHLPIGMLVLALILEFGSLFTRKESPALRGALFYTAVTSVFAVLAGFLLFQGDSDWAESETANDHLWGGIAFSCLCILTFLIKAWTDAGASAAWFYRFLLVITGGTMAYASHDGASLTHGPDYLTKYAPGPLRPLLGGKAVDDKKTDADGNKAAAAEPIVYQDIVAPLLEEKCWKCHNPGKIQGKLRMDTYELLVKGGKEGPGLVAGDAAKSNIIIRMELPMDNDERMPPDEKPGLSPEHISVVKWWINSGAKPDVTLSAANPPADIAAIIAKIQPTASKAAEKDPAADKTASTTDTAADVQKERATIQAAISELQKTYPGAAQFESQASNAVTFTAVSQRGTFSDNDVAKLAPIAPSLISIDLTATPITDAAIPSLQSAKNLRSLRLGETKITDAALDAIATMQTLESLNLYGTAVTDVGLQKLATLKNLKRLYVWGSKATPAGIEALQKALPNCVIEKGI